jgi:oxygen-dependent protoporphyrinogen oxidase
MSWWKAAMSILASGPQRNETMGTIDQAPVGSVAVIGGGITGLAAAFQLRQARPDLHLTVLESSDRLGGKIRTERHQDFTMELGPDSMLRRLPWGVGLCERLGITDQLAGTLPGATGVYTVHGGRTTRMPEGLAIMAPERVWPMVTTRILSWPAKVRLGLERVLPRRTDGADETLAGFARRRMGQAAFERIVQPLASGVFMGDPEQMSIKACFPQFTAMEADSGSLIKATRAARRKRLAAPASGPAPSVFVAPATGLETIVHALADALGPQTTRLQQKVTRLDPTTGGWRLTIEDGATGEQTTEEYEAVIVTTPAPATAALIRSVDERMAELLGGVEYSSCAIVQLAYPTDQVKQPLDAAGMVVPHVEGRPLQACSFTSVKYAGRAPDGTVLMRAFFGGALQPELLELDDDRLVELAREELNTLLGVEGAPILTSVKRWDQSMPQYHVGHVPRVAEIEELAARHPGLELAGATFRGVGIPHCINSGQQAAERVLAQSERPTPEHPASPVQQT